MKITVSITVSSAEIFLRLLFTKLWFGRVAGTFEKLFSKFVRVLAKVLHRSSLVFDVLFELQPPTDFVMLSYKQFPLFVK